jgi:3-keto-5-aminohexanoate cleavage enzyme
MATWLEVALNGPWTRAKQPLMPITVEEVIAEGLACIEAGAAIIHVHAYDPISGRQDDDWQTYARIIEGIRAKSDAIVYPTIPFPGGLGDPNGMSAVQRFSHAEELAKRGLLECGVVDPGSTQIAGFEEIAGGETGFLYANPGDHIQQGLRLAAQYKFHPGYAIYEPGFTRLGAALHKTTPGCPVPIYRFMFSDGFAFGFPPQDWALQAHCKLLDHVAPQAPWMIAGLRVDIRSLIAPAVRAGGHVRVGLEDAPWQSQISNLDLTRQAIQEIEAAGGTPASPAQVRSVLNRA